MRRLQRLPAKPIRLSKLIAKAVLGSGTVPPPDPPDEFMLPDCVASPVNPSPVNVKEPEVVEKVLWSAEL